MKKYELTLLLDNDFDCDTTVKEVIKQIEGFGGKIIKSENAGNKRLAYEIRGKEFAIYYYLDIELDETVVVKLSRWLNIYDHILRYLLCSTFETNEGGKK